MINRFIFLLLIIFLGKLASQDINTYLKMIDDGKMDEVEKSLPQLNLQYPAHPFTLYLNALYNSNGEEALNQYNLIIENHPNTVSSEMSAIKVGEFLYAKGLYSSASEHLKNIALQYPESKNIEQVVDLLKKSFLATGQQDSVDYYVKIISAKYPQLEFHDYDYYSSIFSREDIVSTQDSIKLDTENNQDSELVNLESYWNVQVGAFNEKINAEMVTTRLKSAGYNAVNFVVESGNLYLVQIENISTIEEAVITGEEIQDKLGLNFIIIEN